ncbi:C6 transcription factor [Stagonosporopsis vannaccii]|nr:C6 transcription factor [Stagonosporopsis vannaccii]
MTSLAVVKCDRNDPCGNCVDSNIQCNRTAPTGRSTSKRRRGAEAYAIPQGVQHFGLQTHFTPSPPRPTSVPQSPSIIEAHDFIRREITSGKSMPADRLAVLSSAMSFVSHLSQTTKHEDRLGIRSTRVTNILEDINFPTVELLYWMLRELKGSSIGPHVLDYFKHVSPKSLKAMGLALINLTGDAETLLLYSICVNSAAFKFINTVLSEGDIGNLEDGMRGQAAKYLQSVQLAMTRIHLLAAPSLLFLQSLLCSAFIAQGQGDSVHCWAFISAACKTCEDLNLEMQVNSCRTETEDDLELYYCYVWCHILDKNYSMMLGRTRCLLNHEGLDAVFSSPLNRSLSALLSTYLLFVPVQAIFILELHPMKISNKKALLSRVEYMVADLLDRLKRVHARITELHGPSDSWSGLHMGTELTTIQFSYHSLRTSILRSKQICLPGQPYVDSDCLESARMAMSTLHSIQEAALTLTDIRSHVAYMHWTVLYHPLTPFFVLFCNVVATSNPDDFHTLKCVTDELEGLVELSTSLAKLQMLFKSFIDLCEGLVSSKRQRAITTDIEGDSQTPFTTRSLYDLTPTTFALADSLETSIMQPPTSGSLNVPSRGLAQSVGDTPGSTDLDWGLFDIQPTLDWLDADFSLFDNEQFQSS